MPHPNEEKIRNAFDASLKGNLEPMRSVFDPKVVLHVSGRGPLSGDLSGFDTFLAWARRFIELSGGTWKEDILEIVANDHTAFMRAKYRAKRGERSIEDQFVDVFRIRNGRIVECWLLWGNQYAFDDFWY